MPVSGVGDMRQFFMSTRHNAAIKRDLDTLVDELTTGQSNDLTKHLGLSQTRLSGLDRQLSLIDRAIQSNTQTSMLLATMQTALDEVAGHRASAGDVLLQINTSSSSAQIADAGRISRSSLDGVVMALNSRYGDRAIFGGNALDAAPLSSADDMLDALKSTLTGLTAQTDIEEAISDWFLAPGGGFETSGYQGDATGYMSRGADLRQMVEVSVRADDLALRDVMIGLAKGALAADADLALTDDVRRELQFAAGEELISSAQPLVHLQARLGYAEGAVAEAAARMSARKTALSISRNEMVSADPFETASKLEQVQLQLETHYTLTARLSRLSLTEYLR